MKRKAHPHEHQGELNIIPYLDIMVNLVMFMLMSMAGFITFQTVNVNMPDSNAEAAMDPNTPPPKPEEQKLILNVTIAKSGYFIAGSGGVLPDANMRPPEPGAAPVTAMAPTIPLKGTEYDYDALTMKMGQIKKSNPDVSQFFLAAEPNTKYEVIVKTMDATRGDGAHPLFPDVAFAALSE